MFRTMRMFMIVVACAAAIAVALVAGFAITGASPMSSLTSNSAPVSGLIDSGPANSPSSAPTDTSTSTLPGGSSNASSNASPSTSQGAGQDADGDNDGSQAAESANESAQDSNNANEQANQQEQDVSGAIVGIDRGASTFTVTTSGGPITCFVTSTTQFSDGLSGLASLQLGMTVKVSAEQQSGRTVATQVKGPNDSSNATDSNASQSPDPSNSGSSN